MRTIIESRTASRLDHHCAPPSVASPIVSSSCSVPEMGLGRRSPKLLPAEFLSFRLGGEEYGLDILQVKEIRRFETPTRMANAATFILGMMNLRGVVVPIVDLLLLLGCESAQFNDVTVVIVLNVRGHVIGAVVDSVFDVIALRPEDIRPAPNWGSKVHECHILGIGCVEGDEAARMIILTDIDVLIRSAGLG